jgi:hypothetical protein
VYASTRETFRSSIFFWAFKQSFVGREDMAEAIFWVTGALPGVTVGRVDHVLTAEEFRSEVELEIWPGLRGVVVSTGTLVEPVVYGDEMDSEVLVGTTRVLESNYLPVPAVWGAPVGRVLRDGGRALFHIVYGDAIGHVVRVGGVDGGIADWFVYERVDAE